MEISSDHRCIMVGVATHHSIVRDQHRIGDVNTLAGLIKLLHSNKRKVGKPTWLHDELYSIPDYQYISDKIFSHWQEEVIPKALADITKSD